MSLLLIGKYNAGADTREARQRSPVETHVTCSTIPFTIGHLLDLCIQRSHHKNFLHQGFQHFRFGTKKVFSMVCRDLSWMQQK